MKHGSYLFAALLGVLTACDPANEPEIIDPEPAGEGVAFDEENPDADIEGVGKAAVRDFESVPVAIIDGTELDADGNPVDLGSTPTLFQPGDPIPYAECGSRPDPYETPWTSRHC